jgi:hypothetical protein
VSLQVRRIYPITVTIVVPPKRPTITSVTFPQGGVPTFKLSPTSTGCNYRLNYRTNLTSGSWLPVEVGGWTAGNGGELTLTDPSLGTERHRFYRVELQQWEFWGEAHE